MTNRLCLTTSVNGTTLYYTQDDVSVLNTQQIVYESRIAISLERSLMNVI